MTALTSISALRLLLELIRDREAENGAKAVWLHPPPVRYAVVASRGVWRSLVARFVRDEEVVGSNPATPTASKYVSALTVHLGRGPFLYPGFAVHTNGFRAARFARYARIAILASRRASTTLAAVTSGRRAATTGPATAAVSAPSTFAR